MKSCGAKKKDGGKCKARPMANGRCRIHGGLTPKGTASPHYQTGRYSKYLPKHLADDYFVSKDDPELVTLRSELSLLDARLSQLIQRLSETPDKTLWITLGADIADIQRTINPIIKFVRDECEDHTVLSTIPVLRNILRHAQNLVNTVLQSENAWLEMYGLIEQRRKLVESEAKRIREMQQTITSEQAMNLVTTIATVIKTHLNSESDKPKLRAITADIVRIADYKSSKAA